MLLLPFHFYIDLVYAVVLPGFVARRGKAADYVMGHSRWASGPGAADCPITNSFVTNTLLIKRAADCPITNSFVTNAVLIERAASY